MSTPDNTFAISTLDDVRSMMRCIVDCAEVARDNAVRGNAGRIAFNDLQALRVRFITHVAQLAESLDQGNGAYLINALMPPPESIDYADQQPRGTAYLLRDEWPRRVLDLDLSIGDPAARGDLSDTIAGGVAL
jgi:hypothetical protein